MARNPGSVVDHLKAHVGGALQAVVIYDQDRHRDLYRREDVAGRHDTDLERRVLDRFRDEVERRSTEESLFEGALRATIRVFPERVVVHLPRDDQSGTVVVLDASVAQNAVEFVEDIRGDIYR